MSARKWISICNGTIVLNNAGRGRQARPDQQLTLTSSAQSRYGLAHPALGSLQACLQTTRLEALTLSGSTEAEDAIINLCIAVLNRLGLPG